jgi:hypothetical protein
MQYMFLDWKLSIQAEDVCYLHSRDGSLFWNWAIAICEESHHGEDYFLLMLF